MSNAPTMASAIQFFQTTLAAQPVAPPALLTAPLDKLPRRAAIVRAGLARAGIDSGPAIQAFLIAFGSEMSVDEAKRALDAAGAPRPSSGADRLAQRAGELASIEERAFADKDPAGLTRTQRQAADALAAAAAKARGEQS